jgi:hypothetical protein
MKRKLQLMHVEASSTEYDINKAKRRLFQLCEMGYSYKRQFFMKRCKLNEEVKNEKARCLLTRIIHSSWREQRKFRTLQSNQWSARPVLVYAANNKFCCLCQANSS